MKIQYDLEKAVQELVEDQYAYDLDEMIRMRRDMEKVKTEFVHKILETLSPRNKLKFQSMGFTKRSVDELERLLRPHTAIGRAVVRRVLIELLFS